MSKQGFARPSAHECARWAALPALTLRIDRLWGGQPAPAPGPQLRLSFGLSNLVVEVSAPFHGDPAPVAAPGSLHGLWDYEVVELFLLGDRECYLELEFGPHGHYLALRLEGVRQIECAGMAMEYEACREVRRWHGRASVPIDWLPPGMSHLNAYAIDGCGTSRRYWAWRSAGQVAPDFHRLDCFGTFAELQP